MLSSMHHNYNMMPFIEQDSERMSPQDQIYTFFNIWNIYIMEPCHGPVLRTVSSNVLLRCKKKKKKI